MEPNLWRKNTQRHAMQRLKRMKTVTEHLMRLKGIVTRERYQVGLRAQKLTFHRKQCYKGSTQRNSQNLYSWVISWCWNGPLEQVQGSVVQLIIRFSWEHRLWSSLTYRLDTGPARCLRPGGLISDHMFSLFFSRVHRNLLWLD